MYLYFLNNFMTIQQLINIDTFKKKRNIRQMTDE